MELTIYVLLLLMFLGLSAFFSSAETAFISSSRVKVELLKHKGNMANKADRVIQIIKNPERTISTVLLGNNLVNTAMAALGTIIAVKFMSENIGAAVATLGITCMVLVFGEATPKTFTAHHAERMAFLYIRPLEIISKIFSPFVLSLTWIASNLSKLIGGHPDSRLLKWSEKEIRTVISLGADEGLLERIEADMLHKVFEFGDRPVHEVMTPRTDVVWVEKGMKFHSFLSVYAQRPHSRFPVYEGNFDNVVGIILSKDVLLAIAQDVMDQESSISTMARPVYFVPETKRISELFTEMQARRYQVAIIIDEYGGTSGLVTLNQLVEEIMGELGDELVAPDKEFETIDITTFQVDGNMRVDEASRQLGVLLPEGDYETVAGFIISVLGHIPKKGEYIKYNELKLVITEMKGMRIEKVQVTKEI